MSDPVIIHEMDDVIIHICYDESPVNPREEYDHVATMVCFHRKYKLGDKHDFKSPDEFIKFLESNPQTASNPLYLYDHSGITISTKPFSDPWDSGQVGWIYIDRKKLESTYKKKFTNIEFIEKAKEILDSEVSEYDEYLTGNIYGYEILDKESGDILESCWGFYGQDTALAEAGEAVKCLDLPYKEELPLV